MKRILAFLLAVSMPSFAAELHELRLHRPHKAGDKFAASVKATIDGVMTFSLNDRVAQEKKLDASMAVEGEFEVTEVDNKGRIRSAKMKVTKSEGKVDGSASQVFKPDDVVTAARDDKGNESFKINGKDPTELQAELAGVLVPTSRATSITDDDVYGPGKSVGIGEEWQINSKAGVEEFSEIGKLSPEDIKGTMKLAGAEEFDGKKCLQVRGQVSVKGSGFSMPNVPEFVKVRNLELEADIASTVPTDTSATIPHAKVSMTVNVAAAGETEQNGQKVKVSLSIHRKKSSEGSYKPLK